MVRPTSGGTLRGVASETAIITAKAVGTVQAAGCASSAPGQPSSPGPSTVTSTIAFEGHGRVTEYVGGYEDYLRQRAVQPKPLHGEGGREPSRGEGAPKHTRPETRRSRPRKLSYKEQLELEGLPGRIAALEAEQAQLRDETASPEFYKAPAARIASALARLEEVARELEAVLARWVELEDLRNVT